METQIQSLSDDDSLSSNVSFSDHPASDIDWEISEFDQTSVISDIDFSQDTSVLIDLCQNIPHAPKVVPSPFCPKGELLIEMEVDYE